MIILVIFRVRVHITEPINVIIVGSLIGRDLPPFLTVDIVALYPGEILNLQQTYITEIKGIYKTMLSVNDRWISVYSSQKFAALKTKAMQYVLYCGI